MSVSSRAAFCERFLAKGCPSVRASERSETKRASERAEPDKKERAERNKKERAREATTQKPGGGIRRFRKITLSYKEIPRKVLNLYLKEIN